VTTSTATSTSQDVKEIQDRNAQARGRVIKSGFDATGEPGHEFLPGEIPGIVQAAMMELVAIWREEAAHVTQAKRKGHVGIAKEYTQAAARLAGFAVGLTSRPVLAPDYAEIGAQAAGYESLAAAKAELEPLDHEPQCDCGHPNCAALSLSAPDPAGIDFAAVQEAAATEAMKEGCSHPASAVSTLKSGASLCTLCQTEIAASPAWDRATNGPLPAPTGDPTMDYLTGKTDVYDPKPRATSTEVLILCTKTRGCPKHPDIHSIHFDFPLEPTTIEGEAVQPSPFTSPQPITPADLLANPFSSPGAQRRDVKRLTYPELGPLIAATYPIPRPHLSHSYVESLEGCGLSALLSDASKTGEIGPRRPSWSLVGGSAFHHAIEQIELAALALGGASPSGELGDWREFWETCLSAQIDETTDALAGTAYALTSTWHVANRGLEGYDWWRVEGHAMLERYLAFHDNEWRAAHVLLQVPADLANPDSPRIPVLEFPFTMAAGSTAITTTGFIDAAWMATGPQYPTATLEVVDFKTGKSAPSEHFQLVEYGDILRKHLPPNFALPVVGRYWLARKGIYTDPIALDADAARDEIDYRYRTADRAMRNAVFAPRPSTFCGSCSSVDYCPTQAPRTGGAS
jgi:hypothetical protein